VTLADLFNFGTSVAPIAGLASSVATVATLVYLSQQNRQSARNQRAVMDRGRSQAVADWLQFIAGADIAPLVRRGHAGDPKLDEAERERYRWCVYPLLLHYEDSFLQHKNGMISDEQWESIRRQMTDTSRLSGLRMVWSDRSWGEVRLYFHTQFRDFLDAVFAEAVSPPNN
jgi:hypothetical protein